MKLHEIGLFAKDPQASRKFYHDTLGLRLDHEEPGLSVFDGGWPGIEIGACAGYPDRVHISFIVDDVDELAGELRARGIEFQGPADIHLGKRGIVLRDPDGLRVLIQSPTEDSPDWVKEMVR
ncbi:MAG: VOC family protein [Planctomycetota bacterium]|jgi:catechol 2,3-dioxygenase-like lactoylglutathione lyase family enzyme